jgi:2-succinyl-5-enolpyruvyl-6-hydroxy-3-cyclohexene-1-carboxylate synthase
VNPSTALATVLVDELVRNGVRDAVLAPGSRSAPLALALHAADAAGRLRLHVRIDERSAGFLAVGLAKGSGRPVPVVTTSGTAVANLHPAVLEAAHSGAPVVVLSADRPPELRGAGANQTVDQLGIYGGAVRLFVELGTPDVRAGQTAYWRSAVCRALAAASGETGGSPGPVQVNVGLRDPLVPTDGDWPEPLDGRPDGAPWTARVAPSAGPPPVDDLPARTVVVLGDGPPGPAAAALRLARARGWPVVAEPSSSAPPEAEVLACPELVLGASAWVEAHRPDRVLVVGRPTLARPVGRLAAGSACDVVAGGASGWADAGRRADRVLPAVPAPADGPVDDGWLAAWQAAGAVAASAVAGLLSAEPGLPEPVVAAEALQAAVPGGLLVVGSSKPVRDLFLAPPASGVRVLANRGVAGIDGMVSTALGAALGAGRPAVALLGDLTFLHDANGLVLGPAEPRPDLVLVVVSNDGGAIFGTLEQGGPDQAEAFERVFGTPHGVDLAALCAATHTPHTAVTTLAELSAALRPQPGLRVVEARTDRSAAVALQQRLAAAVSAALS